jgi:hypothetical protein
MKRKFFFLCPILVLLLQTAAQAQWVQEGGNLNSNPSHSGGWPSIATYNGTPYVTWTEDNGSSVDLIWVKSFNGTNWVQVGSGALNTVNTCTAFASRIAFNNSTPYVVWEEFAGTSGEGRQIYVKHFNGSNWVPDGGSLNTLASGDSDYASIAFSAGGVPYVCWEEQHGYSPATYFLYVKHFNGSSWVSDGSNINMSSANNTTGQSLAIANNTPYISWTEKVGAAHQVYVKHLSGSSWIQDGGSLNMNAACDASATSLAIINGTPYVAWGELNASGNTALAQVYVKHLNGSNWIQDGVGINYNSTCSAGDPRLVSYKGTLYVSWIELDPNNLTQELSYIKWYDGQQWRLEDGVIGPLELFQGPPDITFMNALPLITFGNLQGLIEVEYTNKRLSLVTPNSSTAGRSVVVTVAGSPFAAVPAVTLLGNGNPDIPSTSVNQASPNGYTCTFNLSGAVPGVYDVQAASNLDGQVMLLQAFSVFSSNTSPRWTVNDLGAPSGVTQAADCCGLVVGDVDQDDQQELYVATDSLYQYKKYSYGWTVNPMTSGASNNVYSSVVLANSNGDGTWQAFGSQMGNQIYQFAGAVFANTNLGPGASGTTQLYAITQADMFQDGYSEVYAAGDRGVVCEYSNSLTAWRKVDLPVAPATLPDACYCLAAGDGNNDGAPELYSANADYRVYQYSRNAGAWQISTVGTAPGPMNAVAVGDGNNDSSNEVYAACQDGNIYQWRFNGSTWARSKVGGGGAPMYGVLVSDGSNTGSNKVYGACLDQHVYEFKYSNSTWTTTVLPDAGTPLYTLTAGDASNNHYNKIYALGKNNHVFEYVASTLATPTPNITATPSVPKTFLKIYHSQINPDHQEVATVHWCQPQNGAVTITIYNLLGDKVATLVQNQNFNAGQFNQVPWNGHTQAGKIAGSGIYIVLLQAPGYQATAKAAVVK